jgi:hypothetical protein
MELPAFGIVATAAELALARDARIHTAALPHRSHWRYCRQLGWYASRSLASVPSVLTLICFSDRDLKEVGVKSSIRRKILLKAFTALKQQLSNAGYLLGKYSPSVVAKVSFTLCSPRLGMLASHVLQWNQDALHMPAPASLKSLQVLYLFRSIPLSIPIYLTPVHPMAFAPLPACVEQA